MCLSIPVKILSIKNNKAIVDFGDKKEEFDFRLTPDIKIKDYVLVNNGFLIKKISAAEAEEIFKVIYPVKGGVKPKEEI